LKSYSETEKAAGKGNSAAFFFIALKMRLIGSSLKIKFQFLGVGGSDEKEESLH
jgi:hypothetical protein